MALQKFTRSHRAARTPVSPDDLAYLIREVVQDGRNLDAWRGEFASALAELQHRRRADANRAVGTQCAAAKRRQKRLEEPRSKVEMAQHQRNNAMRAAHNARLAFAQLQSDQVRTVVGGHAYRAHCHNRAVRVLRQIRQLQAQGVRS
jgi:hypothetical protein